MQKFLVLYMVPVSVLGDWQKTPAAERKAAEEKMQNEWKDWMARHAGMFADPGAGAGKTKRVTDSGVADSKNDIMLYAIVNADSHAQAAAAFEGHPHLQIPQSSIEVMELHALPAS